MPSIRELTPADADNYRKLRLLGLRESPTAFGSSYEQEAERSVTDFAARIKPLGERWMLGAFAGDELIGMVGFMRDAGIKARHKGFIWGMYVQPDWRGRGIGRRLMVEMLVRIDALPGMRRVRLSVTAINTIAEKLYDSLGFVRYGEEEEALCVEGFFLDEYHMVRTVPPDAH